MKKILVLLILCLTVPAFAEIEIYHFNRQTKEFIGIGIAMTDPLDNSRSLIPAHSTDIKPPKFAPDERIFFISGEWVVEKIKSPQPSAYHTWDGSEWTITEEDQETLNNEIALIKAGLIKIEAERKETALIEKEKQSILEQQAIESLKDKGQLPQDYVKPNKSTL